MDSNVIYQQLTVKCKTEEDSNEIVAKFEIFKANLWCAKQKDINLISYYENKSFSTERVLAERNRQAFERSFRCFQGDYGNLLYISVNRENFFDILCFIEENKNLILRFEATGIMQVKEIGNV